MNLLLHPNLRNLWFSIRTGSQWSNVIAIREPIYERESNSGCANSRSVKQSPIDENTIFGRESPSHLTCFELPRRYNLILQMALPMFRKKL